MRTRIEFAGILTGIGFAALLAAYVSYWWFDNLLLACAVSIAALWLAMHVLQKRFENSARRALWSAALQTSDSRQSVVVEVPLSGDGFGTTDERARIHVLARQLDAAVSRDEVGEYDGDEFGAGRCLLFLYGPDCDALASTVHHVFDASQAFSVATIVKRYGGPGSREVRVDLPAA